MNKPKRQSVGVEGGEGENYLAASASFNKTPAPLE